MNQMTAHASLNHRRRKASAAENQRAQDRIRKRRAKKRRARKLKTKIRKAKTHGAVMQAQAKTTAMVVTAKAINVPLNAAFNLAATLEDLTPLEWAATGRQEIDPIPPDLQETERETLTPQTGPKALKPERAGQETTELPITGLPTELSADGVTATGQRANVTTAASALCGPQPSRSSLSQPGHPPQTRNLKPPSCP